MLNIIIQVEINNINENWIMSFVFVTHYLLFIFI